jgi:branched-chain amino acid transport system substrate-binding protein
MAATLAALVSVGCGSKSGPSGSGAGPGAADKEWKVGVYLGLSGPDAQFGIQTREGIELFVDEVNAAGGVKGKPIKLLVEDDKGNPTEANNKVLQLIDRDKVIAILGEVASSRSKPGGIVANSKKIPMITPSSTNADVTKVGPFVFRVCFIDDFQGQAGARFVTGTLSKKKVAMLYATDDLYSSGLASEFEKELKKQGGEVVLKKGFLKTETNFTTYINEIKDSKPDIIYAPVYYDVMAPIAKQAKAAGVPGEMFLGGDGWDGMAAEDLANLEGAYFTNHYAPDVPWPNAQAFRKRYTERFKHDPTGMAAMGFDAAGVLVDALKRSKDDTAQGLRDAIADTKNFAGATGNISINAERNAEKDVVIVQIKDKQYKFHSVVGEKK